MQWPQAANLQAPLSTLWFSSPNIIKVKSSRDCLALWSWKIHGCLIPSCIHLLLFTSLCFAGILLSLLENKCSLPSGLPLSAPQPRVVTLVMSGDLSVAHFTASTSAHYLVSTFNAWKVGSGHHVWWGCSASNTSPSGKWNRAAFLGGERAVFYVNEGSCCKNSFPSPLAGPFTKQPVNISKN